MKIILVSTGNCGIPKKSGNWWEKEQSEKEKVFSTFRQQCLCFMQTFQETLTFTEVRPNDVKLRNRLYKFPDKQQPHSIIPLLLVTKKFNGRQPNNPNQNKSHSSVSQHAFIACCFSTAGNGRKIPVRKNNFLAISKVGQTRLSNIVTKVYAGESVEEKGVCDRKNPLSI